MRMRLFIGAIALGVLAGCSSADGEDPDPAETTDGAEIPSVVPEDVCADVADDQVDEFQAALRRNDSDFTIVDAVAVQLDAPQDPFGWVVALKLDDASVATLAVEAPDATLRIGSVDARAKEVFQYGDLLGEDDPTIQAAAAIAESAAPTTARACLE